MEGEDRGSVLVQHPMVRPSILEKAKELILLQERCQEEGSRSPSCRMSPRARPFIPRRGSTTVSSSGVLSLWSGADDIRMSCRSSGEEVATESYPSRPSSEPGNRPGRRCFCCGSYEHLVRVCPREQRGSGSGIPGERLQVSGPSSQPLSEDVVMQSVGAETELPR